MTALCDAIVLLSIGLLAIVVAVFVLAASLLGRALDFQAKGEEEFQDQQKHEREQHMMELEDRLQEAKKTDDTRVLEKDIQNYRKRAEAAEKKAKRDLGAYQLLGVREGVVLPSLAFLGSLILTTAAKSMECGWAPAVLCGASALAIAWGCHRLYRVLTVVEKIATASEEAQFTRMAHALGRALELDREAQRPELALYFEHDLPPFAFAPATDQTITMGVSLKGGGVGRAVSIWLMIPEGFELPGRKTRPTSDFPDEPNALSALLDLGDIRPGSDKLLDVTLRTAAQPGEYTFRYYVFCEEFKGDDESFVVRVTQDSS